MLYNKSNDKINYDYDDHDYKYVEGNSNEYQFYNDDNDIINHSINNIIIVRVVLLQKITKKM